MKTRAKFGLSLLLALVGAAACTTRGVSTDGVTSWLQPCERNADCGSDLSCECGVCTRECSGVSECPAVESAACLSSTTAGLTCGSAPASVCASTCNADMDCRDLGADARCRDGFCSRGATSGQVSDPSGLTESGPGVATGSGDASTTGAEPPTTAARDAGRDPVVLPAFDAGVSPVRAPNVWDRAVEQCGQARETAYVAESPEQLEDLLLGDWFSCVPGSFAGKNELGVRFVSDGTYRLLYHVGDGLVEGTLESERGVWEIGDNGTGGGGDPAILVRADSDAGGGWTVYTPTFSDDPLRFSIETQLNGVGEGEFVKDATSTTATGCGCDENGVMSLECFCESHRCRTFEEWTASVAACSPPRVGFSGIRSGCGIDEVSSGGGWSTTYYYDTETKELVGAVANTEIGVPSCRQSRIQAGSTLDDCEETIATCSLCEDEFAIGPYCEL